MDGLYGFHCQSEDSAAMMIPPPESLIVPSDYQAFLCSSTAGTVGGQNRFVVVSDVYGSDELFSAAVSGLSSDAASVAPDIRRVEHDVSFGVVKSKIASHPSYPRLLQAYIDCQKVGAPPEIASFLDEIQREGDTYRLDASSSCFGSDPELDDFMETYCDILVKYKSDLARPFEEATTFLNNVEMQLRDLCTSGASSIRGLSDDGVVSSEEDLSGGETETQEGSVRSEDRDLKDRLLRKFGGHISTLKLKFSKKKKKGKLPREARQTLFDWWNVHYKWPYPTEGDKIALAEATGLDQKQINNWFINQRKRHWKPSENMPFGIMDDSDPGFFTQD